MSFIDLSKRSKIDPRVDKIIEIGGQHVARFHDLDERITAISTEAVGVVARFSSVEEDLRSLAASLNTATDQIHNVFTTLTESINELADSTHVDLLAEVQDRRKSIEEAIKRIPDVVVLHTAVDNLVTRIHTLENPPSKTRLIYLGYVLMIAWLTYLTIR